MRQSLWLQCYHMHVGHNPKCGKLLCKLQYNSSVQTRKPINTIFMLVKSKAFQFVFIFSTTWIYKLRLFEVIQIYSCENNLRMDY